MTCKFKQKIHVLIQSKHFCHRILYKNLKIKIYETIISPVLFYACEAWSLTLRKAHRLRIFENRILRRIFGPKRDSNGEWKRLQNEELHSLYRSPNIVSVIKSKRLKWTGHVARMEEGRSTSKLLSAKPTGKIFFRESRRRWEDNIRMDLEEICINSGNWVNSAQDRGYWRAL
jgi:hypothetical protein